MSSLEEILRNAVRDAINDPDPITLPLSPVTSVNWRELSRPGKKLENRVHIGNLALECGIVLAMHQHSPHSGEEEFAVLLPFFVCDTVMHKLATRLSRLAKSTAHDTFAAHLKPSARLLKAFLGQLYESDKGLVEVTQFVGALYDRPIRAACIAYKQYMQLKPKHQDKSEDRVNTEF